jgi:hypothetical protein
VGVRVKGDGENEMSIELPNGSRIIGLPGNEMTIRGFGGGPAAGGRSIAGERRLVPGDPADAGGEQRVLVALMSTPYGRCGFFYETWASGDPEWERVQVTGEECPRIPKEFLKKEREVLGDCHFRQEYLCEFVDAASSVFDIEAVERALTSDVKPLMFR